MLADEILRITQTALGLGVSRVKLTGGEPLLRSDILQIVKGTAKLRGLHDLSMTTNGVLLSSLAKELHQNGLARVNVNIPTLDSEVYRKLTGGNLVDAISGVKAAVGSGLYPVKLNMLFLRGVNEKEVTKMIEFARRSEAILQIIELEPVNVDPSYYSLYHQPLDSVEVELQKRAVQIKTRGDMQNRRVYFLPGAKVEVIRPIENTEFCSRCTRIRVTSDGKLKPCLMRNDNLVDLLTPIRNGADNEALAQLFIEAVKRREPYYRAIDDRSEKLYKRNK
jgi:cyclic pyranopterin phosphate synthase